jgi:hypothetical protein
MAARSTWALFGFSLLVALPALDGCAFGGGQTTTTTAATAPPTTATTTAPPTITPPHLLGVRAGAKRSYRPSSESLDAANTAI